jgi:hypothetical protein
MTRTDQATVSAEEPLAPESYPTFWDAIPVDLSSATAPAPDEASTNEDAYATFLTLAEDGPASSLRVEQSDVGLN